MFSKQDNHVAKCSTLGNVALHPTLTVRRPLSCPWCEKGIMTQEFDYFSLDQQIDQLFEKSEGHPIDDSINDPWTINEFNQFNDVIAIQSFINSVHAALESNNESSINMAFSLFNSSEKYPNLSMAIRAFISAQYQATLFAANVAKERAKIDTSVNHNFAHYAATLLIIHAHVHLEQDTAVVDSLIEWKKHLILEIGQFSEQWIQTILNSFQPRWGTQRFNQSFTRFNQ